LDEPSQPNYQPHLQTPSGPTYQPAIQPPLEPTAQTESPNQASIQQSAQVVTQHAHPFTQTPFHQPAWQQLGQPLIQQPDQTAEPEPAQSTYQRQLQSPTPSSTYQPALQLPLQPTSQTVPANQIEIHQPAEKATPLLQLAYQPGPSSQPSTQATNQTSVYLAFRQLPSQQQVVQQPEQPSLTEPALPLLKQQYQLGLQRSLQFPVQPINVTVSPNQASNQQPIQAAAPDAQPTYQPPPSYQSTTQTPLYQAAWQQAAQQVIQKSYQPAVPESAQRPYQHQLQIPNQDTYEPALQLSSQQTNHTASPYLAPFQELATQQLVQPTFQPSQPTYKPSTQAANQTSPFQAQWLDTTQQAMQQLNPPAMLEGVQPLQQPPSQPTYQPSFQSPVQAPNQTTPINQTTLRQAYPVTIQEFQPQPTYQLPTQGTSQTSTMLEPTWPGSPPPASYKSLAQKPEEPTFRFAPQSVADKAAVSIGTTDIKLFFIHY
jgi:hypothetical protein